MKMLLTDASDWPLSWGRWELSSLSFLLTPRRNRTLLQAKQTAASPRRHGPVENKRLGFEIHQRADGLTPINFSWLSHGEHSQPEGANAKLIYVLKVLS